MKYLSAEKRGISKLKFQVAFTHLTSNILSSSICIEVVCECIKQKH